MRKMRYLVSFLPFPVANYHLIFLGRRRLDNYVVMVTRSLTVVIETVALETWLLWLSIKRRSF